MSDFVKIEGEWIPIVAVYKKVNGSWVEQTNYFLNPDNNLMFYNSAAIDIDIFLLIAESEYTGKLFYLTATLNNKRVYPTWSITAGAQYATINENGKVTIEEGAEDNDITVQAVYQTFTESKQITVSYDNQLTIEGPDTMVGTSGNVIGRYNSTVVTPVWSITSGNAYATIDSSGNITITDTGTITVSGAYNNYTATKNINVEYVAGSSSSTTVDEDGTITTETTIVVENEDGSTTTTNTTEVVNEDGSSSTTETETTVNEDGSSSTTSNTTNSDGSSTETSSTTSAPDENGSVTTEETSTTTNADGTSSETNSTTVENEDGSSTSQSETIHYDENGDTTGSTTNDTEVNADGSSTSSTTNYNAEGDPTDQQNVATDTTGNIDTQDVEFDENGDPTVTGYTIDTTASEGEGKEIEGNGVNTEFVPFKFASEGFVLNFDFESTAVGQPRPPLSEDTEDTGTNYLYTVLGAKTTAKVGNIWPGFEIRWTIPKSNPNYTDTSKCFIQFNRTLSGESSTSRSSFTEDYSPSNIYHLTVIYDPSNSGNKFIVRNNVKNSNMQAVNKTLQDNIDLNLTIGYSTDHEGNQIRHSNVTVHDFSVAKLNPDASVAQPTISCSNNTVTISCDTVGAKVFYKRSTETKYDLYKAPIAINESATFNAYAIFQHKVSNVRSQACTYIDNTPSVPVITCDGDYITITCASTGASIYYKLGQDGEFTQYTAPIEITQNITVYAYSQMNGYSSATVSENCTVLVVADPVISCSGVYVTIACATQNAVIHYKLGENGTYTTYTNAIEISADTTVYAYATVGNKSSATVSQFCEYDINVEDPVISCDGTYVTITCDTIGASIYYKIGQNGSFTQYSNPIEINETVTVYAYAQLNGVSSSTVSENCTYIPQVPTAPVITCDGEYVTITCETQGASIYYSINGENYNLYSAPIEINEDTTIYAYSSLNNITSTTVTEECIYTGGIEPEINYAERYLTFDILTSGTILWDAEGTGIKTIEYSINDGAWTSVTSTTSGVAINVSAGDSVRFRGSNTRYCNANKNYYSRFGAGTATFNISGNIMSMTAGDNFANVTTLPDTWTFTQFFKESKPVSAEHLILPATTMTECCYRALFSKCSTLEIPPALPATTLAKDCYWYLFEDCAITTAPELLASTLIQECYGHMFTGCSNLNYIKCLATGGFGTSKCLEGWVNNVAATGTFVKDANTSWSTGTAGIPTGWTVYNNEILQSPVITCDGQHVTITCETLDASIYYKLNDDANYTLYSTSISISEDTSVYAYSSKNGNQSPVIERECIYVEKVYKFAGSEIASGPLYYGTNGYEIKDSWNYNSYDSSYGKVVGSTYFNYLEMGELFEGTGFSTADGNIENALDPLGGWRLPASSELASIIGTTRSGSTVNNSANKHYALIEISGTIGLLVFPDDETITGATLTYMDSSTANTGITSAQLTVYLGQGCIFLPVHGYRYTSDGWHNTGARYLSSTEANSNDTYMLAFSSNSINPGNLYSKDTTYAIAWLIKNSVYGTETPFEASNKTLLTWEI